jgi:hypothetical protein
MTNPDRRVDESPVTTEEIDPRRAVDELEAAVVDHPDDLSADSAEDEDEAPTPAFDIDLDPGQQGTAEAAASSPD